MEGDHLLQNNMANDSQLGGNYNTHKEVSGEILRKYSQGTGGEVYISQVPSSEASPEAHCTFLR